MPWRAVASMSDAISASDRGSGEPHHGDETRRTVAWSAALAARRRCRRSWGARLSTAQSGQRVSVSARVVVNGAAGPARTVMDRTVDRVGMSRGEPQAPHRSCPASVRRATWSAASKVARSLGSVRASSCAPSGSQCRQTELRRGSMSTVMPADVADPAEMRTATRARRQRSHAEAVIARCVRGSVRARCGILRTPASRGNPRRRGKLRSVRHPRTSATRRRSRS